MARRRAWARLCEVTAVWWLAWSRAMRTVTVKESGSAPHLCPRMGREALALSPVLRTPPLPAAHDRAGPGVSTRPELRDRHIRPPRIRAQYGRDRAVPQVRLRRGRAPRPAVPTLQRRAVGHGRDGPDARADSRRTHGRWPTSCTRRWLARHPAWSGRHGCLNGAGGGTDHVDHQVRVGEHGHVAAVGRVGGGAHPLGAETFQVGVNGTVVVGHDVPARLRPPGGAVELLIEQV